MDLQRIYREKKNPGLAEQAKRQMVEKSLRETRSHIEIFYIPVRDKLRNRLRRYRDVIGD